MEKIKTTYRIKASKEDVVEALKLLAQKHGSCLTGDKITVNPVYKTETIPLGVYDCDYVKTFDGLEIIVEN